MSRISHAKRVTPVPSRRALSLSPHERADVSLSTILLVVLELGCGGAGLSGTGGSGNLLAGAGGTSGGGSGTPSHTGGSPGSGGEDPTGATGGGALASGGRSAGTGGAPTSSGGEKGAGGKPGDSGTGGILSAAGRTGQSGGASGPIGGGMPEMGITCTPQTWETTPIGWAQQGGGTTGGGSVAPVVVTTLAELNAAAGGTSPAVIHVSGKIGGAVKVGSNKTILGLCGAEINPSFIDMTGSSNVIMRNLKIVGYNCSDSPSDCSAGFDAIHVQGGDRNLWFDHLDVSDGSDGTLDITHACDFITISWTKFHYSGRRPGGHQFCNLVGHDDANGAEDTGHLNVTFHHVWWADNVDQRMPRVRFGKVHVFNSLFTATGDSACIEVGVSCNIRSENNVFQGVKNAVDSSHANAASIIESIGNVGAMTNLGGPSFMPPYPYTLDPAAMVAAAVMAGAGPQ